MSGEYKEEIHCEKLPSGEHKVTYKITFDMEVIPVETNPNAGVLTFKPKRKRKKK